jgi:hypothetical protein
MKISRIQIKKIKNLKIQILSDGTYLKANRQESVQESTKNPKLKNKRTIKSLQNLMWQGIYQESKILKYLQKKFYVLERPSSLPAYLRWLFLKIVTAPPPYTMEGNNPPSIYGGDQLRLSPQISKQQMRNQ